MKKKKMTYAEVADKLTKKIGELEEKLKSSDKFAQETAKKMLPRYKEKLDALFAEQERVKGAQVQPTAQGLPQFFDGGALLNAGMGIAQGFGQGQQMQGDSMAGAKGAVDAGIATALGPYGAIYTAGKALSNAGQNALASGTYTDDQGQTYNTYSNDGARMAAAWMKPQHEYLMDAFKKGDDGKVNWKDVGLSLIPGVQQMRAGAGQMYFEYGGKLPKMQPGGPVPRRDANIPTTPVNPMQAYDPSITYMPKYMTPEEIAAFNAVGQYSVPKPFDESQINTGYYPEPPMETVYNQSQSLNYRPDVPSELAGTKVGKAAPRPLPTTPSTLTSPDTRINDIPTPAGEKSGFNLPEFNMPQGEGKMNWNDMLYKGAAYAPTIYNTIQGLRKPQVLEAEDFQNPYEAAAMKLMANRRYNVDPELQASRSTLNNMKQNLKNYAGGNAATYLSNLGALQMNTDKMKESIYAKKQNMDNRYKAEDAQMRANLGNIRAQRELQIQDINDKNKAVRDAHMGKAVEGLSSVAQNERRMSNLSLRDQERLAALQNMFPDYGYSTDKDGYVTGFTYKG